MIHNYLLLASPSIIILLSNLNILLLNGKNKVLPVITAYEFYLIMTVLVRISIAMEKHYDHSNFYKGHHLIGVGLQFRGLFHYLYSRKHGST